MYRTLTAMLCACALLGACSAPDTHGTSTDENGATRFITANTAPPETATDRDGDGVMRDGDGRPYGYALLGQPLPEFSAPMVSGETFHSTSIDQWTIIDVWGIWCGDCMADAPYAAALSRAVEQDPELDFISIHTPPNARRADEAYGRYGSVAAYFTDAGYSYPTVLDADAALRDQLQIMWTPTYLLASPDGIVRGFRTDLSVAGELPVKDFLQDVARVRGQVPDGATETVIDPLYQIGPQRAGRIVGTTPFTQGALEAAFSPLEVRAHTGTVEGESQPVFHISQTRTSDAVQGQLYTIEPSWDRGHVHAVITRNRSVVGPGGARIGATVLADLSAAVQATCAPGEGAYSAVLICTDTPDAPKFAWIFDPPEGFDGDFPAASPDIQQAGILAEMRMLPPSPAD